MRCSASFLLRAVGDAGSGALSWASPIGWAQKARPYAESVEVVDVVWPLGLCLVVAAALGLAAVAGGPARLRGGPGAAATGPGPGHARPAQPFALAFRLQRGAVVWWTVSVVAMAVAWGSLANSIEEFTKDNESLQDVLARSGSERRLPLDHAALLGPDRRRRGAAGHHPAADRGDRAPGRHRAGHAGHAVELGRWPPRGGVHRQRARRRGRWTGARGHLRARGRRRRAGPAARRRVARVPAAGVAAGRRRWRSRRGAEVGGRGVGIWAACLVLGLFGTLIEVPEAIRDLSPFEAVPALPAESMHWCRSASWPRSPWRSWRPASPPAAATSADGDRGGLRSATGPTLGSST